jgi:cobalt-zinc-cadmium efflux system membrane fusion protein
MYPFQLSPFGLLARIRMVAALFCVATALLSSFSALAHEGHSHDDDTAKAALAASTYPRTTAQSDLYEVVAVARDKRLTIYLDRFATNEPVTDARLKIAIGDGEPVEAERTESGSYVVPLPDRASSGSVDVVFTIEANSGDDLLVSSLTLSPPSAPVLAVTPSRWIASLPVPVRNPVVLTFVAFGLGVLFGRLHFTRRVIPAVATGAATVVVLVTLVAVVFGEDGSAPSKTAPAPQTVMSDAPRRLADGTAFVSKPSQRLLEVRTSPATTEEAGPAVNLIGRVIGDPNRNSVVQSIHGGRVIPLESGLPRIGQQVRKGDILAKIDPYLPLADRTTILEKTGEIEQLIAVADARVRRLRPLAERGAVPSSQVSDAETELEGLRLRREVIRNTRTEPELLRAPTDGVIASAKATPGQVVQAQDILFQIVDPKGYWVEALVYGQVDPQTLNEATAIATGGQSIALAFRGFSPSLQQHASIVQFAVTDTPAGLSIGQPVTVVAKSGAPVKGLVVPREAVVRSSNGEAAVWLHVEPERFESRPVRTQSFDASRLIVAGGVAENERIVIRAADLINQIR